jgi:outer membrane protein
MRVFALFFLCLLCFSSYATNLKIGFIDTNEIVISLTQYKRSIEEISSEFEPKKQELLDLYNHIELIRSNLDSKQKFENSELLKIEITKLSKLEESFKQETEFWQKEMNDRKVSLLKKIELLINQTINNYAIRENYDLILYENVAFVSDKVNITQEIIAEIEKN